MKVTLAVVALVAVVILTPGQIRAQQSEPIAAAPSSPPAAQERVRVQGFHFTGNQVIDSKTLTQTANHLQGGREELTLAELRQIADGIADYYHKQGYFLAQVLLPAQEIASSTVTFQVVEGRLGQIRIEGNRYYSTSFIARRLPRQELLSDIAVREETVNRLKRALLVLNENPGLRATSSLEKGTQPGTTDLVVTVEDSKPISRTFEFNNFGSRLASRERFIPSLDLANLSGRGDSLSLRLVGGAPLGDLFFGRARYALPLNAKGTRLAVDLLAGRFEVGQEFAILGIEGRGTTFGVAATHPVYKSRVKSVTAELGLDLKNSKLDLLGAQSSDDKIRSLRLGAHFDTYDRKGRTFASLFVHQGLGDFLGGMDRDAPRPSRVGGSNHFTKFTLDGARVQRLTSRTFLIARAAAQVSSRSLVVGEQFSIGGADSVRGYPQSEFLGDDGAQVSLEARISPRWQLPPWMQEFQVALFADHGVISIKNPVTGQDKSQNLTGAGFGVRANLKDDISLRADFGFALKRRGGDRPIPSAGGNTYLQIVKRF